MDKKIIVICKTGKEFVEFCQDQGINHMDNNVLCINQAHMLRGLDLSDNKVTIYRAGKYLDIPKKELYAIDEIIRIWKNR